MHTLKRNIILARLITGSPLHAGNAFWADMIASLTVALEAISRCLLTSPLAGLYISIVAPSRCTFFPFIKCPTVVTLLEVVAIAIIFFKFVSYMRYISIFIYASQ